MASDVEKKWMGRTEWNNGSSTNSQAILNGEGKEGEQRFRTKDLRVVGD
jgi:hypothetical protein